MNPFQLYIVCGLFVIGLVLAIISFLVGTKNLEINDNNATFIFGTFLYSFIWGWFWPIILIAIIFYFLGCMVNELKKQWGFSQ